MQKRKGISKKIRFEVFKRDSFTCQYCGSKAPDVLLVIDHIQPVAKAGKNDILNLITACKECNAGKSDRQLSDTATIDKRRQQLEELQERKEQIEMMFQWQRGLMELDEQVIQRLSEYWAELVSGLNLNENGIKELKSLKRKFEASEIMEAMKIAAEHYLKFKDGSPTHKSVEVAWKKVSGICHRRKEIREYPYMERLYYIRGILRNRLSYLDEIKAIQLLKDAVAANATIDSLEKHAKSVDNWTEWRTDLEEYIEEHGQTDNGGSSPIRRG